MVTKVPTSGFLQIQVPDEDCDVVLTLPSGKDITIQFRPSNADPTFNYKGSLDIILPENLVVNNFLGDDLTPAKPLKGQAHSMRCKQIVTEIV